MDRLASTLLEMVAIDSLTASEHEMVQWIQSRLADLGKYQLFRYGMTLCYLPVQRRCNTLLTFYGHTDTVTNQQTRTPYVDEHYLYGCGASDMKAGLAVMFELLLASEHRESPYDLGFVFYDQEEGPFENNGLEPTLQQCAMLKESDLAFVLEPTSNTLQSGCVGTIHAKVTFRGKSGHSARPWEGENAFYKAWPTLRALAELPPKEVDCSGLKFYEVLTPTLMQGGQTRNSVPAELVVNINYRFAPGKQRATAEQDVRELIIGEAEVEYVDYAPAGAVVHENAILSDFQGLSGAPMLPKQAWTDIARLGMHGIAAVNFGPGDPAWAHQKDERASLKDLAQSYQLLSEFVFPSFE